MTPNRRYRLLIADDDRSFRDVLRAIFEPWFALVEAESGEEAVQIVGSSQVDLLVLDMHMNELTGLETITIVKRIESRLPCILVTADATDDLCREARQADAWSVLAKPVRKHELIQSVSTAMDSTYGERDVFSARSSMN